MENIRPKARSHRNADCNLAVPRVTADAGRGTSPAADPTKMRAGGDPHQSGRCRTPASHWPPTGIAAGPHDEGFTPEYQLRLIHQGTILPWLDWPPTDRSFDANFKADDPRRQKYIERSRSTSRSSRNGPFAAPLSFLATQWESELTYDKAFLDLPPDKNPNVVGLDGKVQSRVCPFGPVEPSREVGRRWTDSLHEAHPGLVSGSAPGAADLQQRARQARLERSGTVAALPGQVRPRPLDDFKRKVVGDGWISTTGPCWRPCARTGQPGLEEERPLHRLRGLPAGTFWALVGLEGVFAHHRRPARSVPFCWDGGSPSYYLHNWMAQTDYTLWSPQVESMNWVFALQEVYAPGRVLVRACPPGTAISRGKATTSGGSTRGRGSRSRPGVTRDSCSSASG